MDKLSRVLLVVLFWMGCAEPDFDEKPIQDIFTYIVRLGMLPQRDS